LFVRPKVAIENELMHREAEVDMHSDPQVQQYRQRQADLARSHAQQSQAEAARWEEHRQRVKAVRQRQHHNLPSHVQLFPNNRHG
jgi:L-lactate utilization protein LutB